MSVANCYERKCFSVINHKIQYKSWRQNLLMSTRRKFTSDHLFTRQFKRNKLYEYNKLTVSICFWSLQDQNHKMVPMASGGIIITMLKLLAASSPPPPRGAVMGGSFTLAHREIKERRHTQRSSLQLWTGAHCTRQGRGSGSACEKMDLDLH